MKKTNAALHSARLRKSWTREFVSQKVGVSLTTYTKWELGQQIPPITSQKTLCEVFAMSSQELGFEEATHHPLDGYLNQPVPRHSPLPPVPQAKGESAKNAESFENWAESMGVCWKIYMQGGHLELEKQLPDYFCNLKGPALFPGPGQVRAAHVLSEAYQLQALLKLHRADFIAAQVNCTQAINYSQLAKDRNIFIAAQIRMGNILSYHKQPRAALAAYEEALRHINGADHYISPLLHSLTFAGIGTLYAALGSEKEALQYLQLAVGTLPEDPEGDLAYTYMRGDASVFILHEGLILLKLGHPQLAWDALTQIEDCKPAVSKRVRAEILHLKACTGLTLGNKIQCCIYLEAAIRAAREIKSVYFLNENYALYEHTLSRWGQESRVRTLAKLFP